MIKDEKTSEIQQRNHEYAFHKPQLCLPFDIFFAEKSSLSILAIPLNTLQI